MMLPPRATRDGGKDFGLHPVCAGPYRFVDRVAQDHVTLERFPGYWNTARVHHDRVTYRIIPDSSVRLANLQAGALDIANIAPLDADSVKRDARLNLITVQSLGCGALTINTGAFPKAETPLGRDPRVRRAFELSIDRAALSQVVFPGMYTPNAQATSVLSPLYDPSIKPPGRDVAKARALLKEAGVATPLVVPLTITDTPQGVQAAEVIQSMAAEAGFAVQVNAMEFGAGLAAVRRGDFAVTLGGWSGLLDTDSDAWSFLHSDGALNMARYGNATVDAKLDAARATGDLAARRELYAAMWRQVNQDLPLIYLWTPRNIAGVSSKVAGFTLLADGLYRLQDVRPAP